MNTLNRRQWLRRGSIASALALVGGPAAIARPATSYAPRPILPDQPVRLSSNENPYGPSPKVRQAIIDHFDQACRYPYSYLRALVDDLAKKEGVTKDHIVVTGGSTEGLKLCGMIYGANNREIVAGDPTFQAMLTYAEKCGGHVHRVPLNDKLEIDLNAMSQRINNRTGLIFLCNPNNPTGTLLPADQVRDFCESTAQRTVVFSDEAYYDYIEDPDYPSMVELVKEDANVIVSRTFSKVYGMAGIRIGYMVARPDIANRLKEKVVAFTNTPALFAAREALRDQEFYDFSLAKNREAKKRIYGTLDGLGMEYVPSQTNFIFFKTGQSIADFGDKMLQAGVQVGRPFPPYLDWCRISTGSLEEVDTFNSALKKVMS
jgi:histidinol-phosphate aminotransferase